MKGDKIREREIAERGQRDAKKRKRGQSVPPGVVESPKSEPMTIIKEAWAREKNGGAIADEHNKAKALLEYIEGLNKKRGVVDEKKMDTLGFDLAALRKEEGAEIRLIGGKRS